MSTRPMVGEDLVLNRVKALQVGQVDLDERGAATVVVNPIRDRLSGRANIEDDHMRAEAGQGHGDLLADAARGAGHHGDAPVERAALQAELSE